ncbi:hypothetical protein [Burkholderia vietnamiensis]|uniref:hypothetical protein n=1 Tax=Burkholderia vietnamiensis TaxID=60552 RepID=UPI001CF1416C|nr:hypothetical protein [Burkholderia vietnamiensis]MCA7984186.1 hypothetical protein [Burkholderia vietnamiensis]
MLVLAGADPSWRGAAAEKNAAACPAGGHATGLALALVEVISALAVLRGARQ